MLFIERPQTDPYFNIAAEEYLLRTLDQDCFMLWVNEPSVIIGKHQNAFAEIDHAYVRENGIPVIRRISGGGTVFHDPGNLNFSFIASGEREKLVDFRKFTAPVIAYLQSLGLPARFEGKNDIRIDGLKVSGNAEHVYKDRVLHHGTLLYSSRLDELNAAIRGKESLFESHAVRSVRSKVVNITDLLSKPPSLDAFRAGIIRQVQASNPGMRMTILREEDRASIQRLAREKYMSWDWNYGYSPGFTYVKEVSYKGRTNEIRLEIRNGIIREVSASAELLEGLHLAGWKGKRFDADDLLEHFERSADAGFTDLENSTRLIRDLFG